VSDNDCYGPYSYQVGDTRFTFLDLLRSTAQRRRELRRRFGFICQCSRCTVRRGGAACAHPELLGTLSQLENATAPLAVLSGAQCMIADLEKRRFALPPALAARLAGEARELSAAACQLLSLKPGVTASEREQRAVEGRAYLQLALHGSLGCPEVFGSGQLCQCDCGRRASALYNVRRCLCRIAKLEARTR
jgi:hypothetical protein